MVYTNMSYQKSKKSEYSTPPLPPSGSGSRKPHFKSGDSEREIVEKAAGDLGKDSK